MGTPDRLAALYLLAKADAEATGPAAWTPWRRTLIHELVAKVQHVLERGAMGTEIAEDLAVRVDRVRAFLEREPQDDVEAFLARVPRAYLLAVEPERVARHYPTIQPPVGALDVRAVHLEGGRAGTYELLVVARDRAGLLSCIAGSLALAGLSILTAQAFTTDDGVAIDRFEVEGCGSPWCLTGAGASSGACSDGRSTGRFRLERRVEEKRRWYPRPRCRRPCRSSWTTARRTSPPRRGGASDRLGLLYDITRTLSELGLDVHLATVATYEGRVVDSFYVRDDLGRKFTGDPSTVSKELRNRLEPTPLRDRARSIASPRGRRT